MPHFTADFPFEIIKKPDEDYFFDVAEAKAAGFDLNQIWAVSEEDHVFTYGPSTSDVDVIGYIATTETHDGETYYIEDLSDEFDDDDED